MKITIVLGHLRLGGAERVAAFLANGLAERGHEVTVLTFSQAQTHAYELSVQVAQINLNMERPAKQAVESLWQVMRRIHALRQALHQHPSDIVLAWTDRLNVMTLLARPTAPVLIALRNTRAHNGLALNLLSRWLYPWADAVISNTPLTTHLSAIPAERRHIILNPLTDINTDEKPYPLPSDRYHIMTLGRLEPVKHHALLLRAFAPLKDTFPDWDVVLIGEGALRPALERLRDELDLNHRVIFTGTLTPPFATLRQGEIFVLTSHTEGLPNALMEAMGCGLACISTDYDGDPRVLITPDEDGIIVPVDDVEGLRSALKDLMTNAAQRQKLGEAAKRVRERFAPSSILDQWENLLKAYAHA